MAASLNLCYSLVLLLVYRASSAPVSPSKPDPICSSAQLIAPGQDSLIYKYTTEVKFSVVHGQFDLKNEISADVHIKNLGDCNYALQLKKVQITETRDEDTDDVTSAAQKELENTIVRFRWVDGFVIAVEADASAKVDHVNFIKGILSTLQVYSPVHTEAENIVREEDVLGVCTTKYKYSQKNGGTQINKKKDLSTCSRDKLHLSSSPVLTSLLGPLIEESFSTQSNYVCQTDVKDKKIQSVKCKTVEINTDDVASHDHHDHAPEADGSSEEDGDTNFDDNEDISPKLVAIKQTMELQSSSAASVDANAVRNPVRQTLQFVPTASFDKSNLAVSDLVSKIKGLLNSKDWDKFAAAQFTEIANELRRMDKAAFNAFKSNADIKNLVPTFLDTIYAHDPDASLLNLDTSTLTFANPLAVFYLDSPSKELVDQIVQGAQRLTAAQVPQFVGLAATILKKYKARQTNIKDANMKIKDFQRAISRFVTADKVVATAALSAYARLGLYDDQVRSIAADDQAALELQYHALHAIHHIDDDFIDEASQFSTRRDLQNILLQKLKNTALKNAVRVWAFEALYTPFIYNPEESDSTLGDELEKELGTILGEPLNQVNGYMWTALKYSSLDRLCPLRGLAARLRVHHENKKQFAEQATISSRRIELELPLRKNYQAVIHLSLVFENDRHVPSFIAIKLAFDGIRRETMRLPWVDAALIIENLDWNVADYFMRLDPLNKNKETDDSAKEQAKNSLPGKLKGLQDEYDNNEDPDPSVHLSLKLFGADIRTRDITENVQKILKTNLRTFLRGQLMTHFQSLAGKNPVFRIPLEIGAASAAANGLTLYKAAQVSVLADLTSDFKETRDSNGIGMFKLTSRSSLSFALTLQREVSSPLANLGETIQLGALSNIPFEYSISATENGRTREFNLLNAQSTLLTTEFQYLLRTSKGLKAVAHLPTTAIEPSCTPSVLYRGLGLRACLDLVPFRSLEIGTRAIYPMTITVNKDPSIQKWRIGWRFNAQDAPQYEVAIEKVGATGSYPGLGISATKTGDKFDIKVLTGMKSFNIKGTQKGNKFDGSIFSNENKEVMTTSGTITINNDGFKVDSKVYDITSKKEILALKTEILPNRGQGLATNIELSTPDKARSVKIHFRGDLYKPDSKLIHIDGSFNLGDTSYSGKAHLERNSERTQIELRRSMKYGKDGLQSGYDFYYERKTTAGTTDNSCNVASHFSLRSPGRPEAMKLFDFKSDFSRAADLSTATIKSSLDFMILTRNPPVRESVQFDYSRRSVRPKSLANSLISPEGTLNVKLQTSSNMFNFLIDHRHRMGPAPFKKGPVTAPPTFNVYTKFHIAADSNKLLPDIPRPFAFDISSDLKFEKLNIADLKLEYSFPLRPAAGSFVYHGEVDKVVDGHLFSGPGTLEITWNNNQNKATAIGTFAVCLRSSSLKAHWEFDTDSTGDKNDIELDLYLRMDDAPQKDSPKSLIVVYDISMKAPKREGLRLIDIDGNFTKQLTKMETFNSIAYRSDNNLKEFNLNGILNRDPSGDGSLTTHIGLSLPFKYLPYITHSLKLKRSTTSGRDTLIESTLLAKPVFSHYAKIDIDRAEDNQPPCVHVENELEYLRGNGDVLFGASKVDVHRWSKLHSSAVVKRNTDVLHKHSIGYIFSSKTRKLAFSLASPQLSGNPLSFIAELTIDRENRIGKLLWPQEFAFHVEFGTPITRLTGIRLFYNLPMFNKNSQTRIDGALGFKLASPRIAPVGFYLSGKGSLDTTLKVKKSVFIGNDVAIDGVLTAQYNPQLISQISVSGGVKFYEKTVQNTFYALFKPHQVVVRGIFNTSGDQDYKYEMDIGFDDKLLTGHTERTNGPQTFTSDIEANQCTASGKYSRCYKGDITIQSTTGASGGKGSFDVSWGRGTAKLDIKVPTQLELKFDHTHSGRIRDDDFSSKTTIDAKSLRSDNKGSLSYSGTVEKNDGKWNTVQFQTGTTDMKTGQKAYGSNFRMNQQVTDKLAGQVQRTTVVSIEKQGYPVIDWSSKSVNCKDSPSNVLLGMCKTATFTLKASNALAQRLRQRLELPEDPRISNPTGQVSYDGTLQLDFKFDPKAGPHTVSLDVNRLAEDAVDINAVFQQRYDNEPMNVRVKAKFPRQNPISIKYDETRRSQTNFQGVLKYSFNANDNSAEKTYQCEVDRPDPTDFSINCQGERTTLTIDIDRTGGKSKLYIDLNRFVGERFGYELVRDPQTRALDATLYTLVTSWNIKRQPGQSTIVTVKQKGQEVLRVEGIKAGDQEIQIRFLPAGTSVKLTWDKSTVVTLKQVAPEQRDLLSITIDRARIRQYLPSLRNQNRPAYDIDGPVSTSSKPLFEIAFDSRVLLSLSQALDKVGSHNGLYGLDTIKKAFKLQLGDAPLTVYNIQHWKTHEENTELPESYSIRIVNNANGNFMQLATYKWNEHRLVSKLGHSLDGGKTFTTAMSLDRDYAHQVGSLYFLKSFGYRNIQGAKEFRNVTRNFIRGHIFQGLEKSNAIALAFGLRARIRSILDVDYKALKAIVDNWSQEPEQSFLRQWSARVGLGDFFTKYPSYGDASDRIFAIIRERAAERAQFWRDRFEAIMNENRLKDLTERIQARRLALIKRLTERAEKILDRLLPKVDQAAIDQRISSYVEKLLAAFKQVSEKNKEKTKAVFKAIDDASKGDENKWFRILVADIDSAKFAAAIDEESKKVFRKLEDSSKLFIGNIQKLSRRMTKRREAFRERVFNAIRHLPKVYINSTNVELLVPVGRRPGSYSGTSELMLGIGSLLRNRDQALDTIRSVLRNRFTARAETMKNYMKAFKSIAKRLMRRRPSLLPEYRAIIAKTGDAIDVHGHYMYLNPACDYVLAHDFGDLRFSFKFSNGKVESLLPSKGALNDYDCSNTGRVQICNNGQFYTLTVPIYYGGRVSGALGDVRVRTASSQEDLSRWALGQCPAAASERTKTGALTIPACYNDDDDEQAFCENFVLRGEKDGKDKRALVAQVLHARS